MCSVLMFSCISNIFFKNFCGRVAEHDIFPPDLVVVLEMSVWLR